MEVLLSLKSTFENNLYFQYFCWLQLRHKLLGQYFENGLSGGFNVECPGVVLGFWLWSCCSFKDKSLVTFPCYLDPRSFQNAELMLMSSLRLMVFHSIFCLFINSLISGDNSFTNRAIRTGWVTLKSVLNCILCFHKLIFFLFL